MRPGPDSEQKGRSLFLTTSWGSQAGPALTQEAPRRGERGGSVLGSDLSGPGRATLINILECVNTERSPS